MAKWMRLALWISLMGLALPALAMAAQVTIQYDEPAAPGNDCSQLRVYYCFGANCIPRSSGPRFSASDANCGLADRQLVFDLNIPQNRIPGQMCFKVTVVNTAGNESTGVISCVAITSS